MQIVIFGCESIGLETLRLLPQNRSIDKIFMFNRSYPQNLKEHLGNNLLESRKIVFSEVDAENEKSVENAFLSTIKEKIDVLICTVSVYSCISPNKDFGRFKSDFDLNILSTLIPVKVALEKTLFISKARIIVISSIAGHYAAKTLTAYYPSMWALESLSSTLRAELKSQAIRLDVISPAVLRSKYSQIFGFEHGVDPLRVAKLIQKILNKSGAKNILPGKNYFVPFYYYKFHLSERTFPMIFDIKSGLKPGFQRKKLYRNMVLRTGLITGASSGLGKELAILYSKKLENLYLIDKNLEGLEKVKETIESTSDCSVFIFCLDLNNLDKIAHFTDEFPAFDLLINCAGLFVLGAIKNVPLDIYQNIFNVNFYAGVLLISKLLDKPTRPKKIINILSINAISNPINQGLYSSSKAALWSFTRSLRRTYGNEMQVIEVIPSPFLSNLGAHRITLGEQMSQKAPQKTLIDAFTSKLDSLSNLNSENVANSIFRMEQKGEEIIFIPFLAKLVSLKETLKYCK